MRLSRKADEAAGKLAGRVDFWIRSHAALNATVAGKEFADEEDVKAAWMLLTLEWAKKAHPELADEPEQKPAPSDSGPCDCGHLGKDHQWKDNYEGETWLDDCTLCDCKHWHRTV